MLEINRDNGAGYLVLQKKGVQYQDDPILVVFIETIQDSW